MRDRFYNLGAVRPDVIPEPADGQVLTPVADQTTPEPSAITLLVVALAAGLRRRS